MIPIINKKFNFISLDSHGVMIAHIEEPCFDELEESFSSSTPDDRAMVSEIFEHIEAPSLWKRAFDEFVPVNRSEWELC